MFHHDAQLLKSPVLLADVNSVLPRAGGIASCQNGGWILTLTNRWACAASLPRSLLSLGRGVELNVKAAPLPRYP